MLRVPGLRLIPLHLKHNEIRALAERAMAGLLITDNRVTDDHPEVLTEKPGEVGGSHEAEAVAVCLARDHPADAD